VIERRAAPLRRDPLSSWYSDLLHRAGVTDQVSAAACHGHRAPGPPPQCNWTLAPVLEDQGFEIDDPARREAFFRAWTAQRARHIVRRLLAVIGEAHPIEAAASYSRLRQ